MRKIKVFIVEDSILMQRIITDILSSDEEIEVVGTTKLGEDALKKIPEIKPDVVTLDMNLPDINGLTVLRGLMQHSPVKVIMLSAYTQRGADVTMKALEIGALDFIPKPSGEVSLDLYNFREEIVSKIKIVDKMNVTLALEKAKEPEIKGIKDVFFEVKKVVVIGASTGGPRAIMELMSKVAVNNESSFLIIQHMPKGFTKSFAERISWYSNIRTKEAEDGEFLLAGAAYVAPAGHHMIIEKMPKGEHRYCIRLDETELVNYMRPAADVTMKSVSEIFAGKIIGVILTGMGKDGLEGARKIKKRGGRIVVQDKTTSVVYGMPKMVAEAGLADDILPLENIADTISNYLRQ